MKAKGLVDQVFEDDRTWDEFPDEMITGIEVSIAGDPPANIPNRNYRITDLHLDPAAFSEGDWNPMLAEIRDKVVELFNLLDGEGEPVVYFQTANDQGSEEPALEPAPLEADPLLAKDAAIHPGADAGDELPPPPAVVAKESVTAKRIHKALDEGKTVVVEVAE